MTQQLLNLRVRPARVALLINREAKHEDLLLAFEFFSKLWGGRFANLLPVDPDKSDDLTAFRLNASRPEFIYGIGLNDDVWAEATRQICQPRGYGQLRPEFLKEIKQSHAKDHIPIDPALIHLFDSKANTLRRKQHLRLVRSDGSSVWTAYCGAMFGTHHANLRPQIYDEEVVFTANSTVGFVELAIEFVEKWQQSWLDVTGHELNPHFQWSHLSPTIVLVDSLVSDLSLFWNLRTPTDTTYPAWIIPIPVEGSTDPDVLEKLKKWLLAFLSYGDEPNYCMVTSQSVAEEKCITFAAAFQQALSGTPIEAVDYEPPANRISVVIPVEYETIWPVSIVGRKLSFQPPRPKALSLSSSAAWIVDLAKDVKTGRAVEDVQLPSGSVVSELLNGPCPPSFGDSTIRRTADGSDCINIRCSGNNDVINIYLPTAEEVLGEILREHGLELVFDEKRSSYEPVINRFGGLHPAASAFSGQSGMVLKAIKDTPTTLSELKGACKLGTGKLAGQSYMDGIEQMLKHETERMQRIARARFARHVRRRAPDDFKVTTVLEHWVAQSVVTRQWKIGPCGHCHQQYFVSHLNIQKRIVCVHCGHQISLPTEVSIGYSLHPAVRHAITDGIIPVALTGRFLRNLTDQGFFWLPGAKYKVGSERGDIDVLACCDGILVFCECKCLEHTEKPEVWDQIVAQFLETAKVAQQCNGSLAVLAALVDAYPDSVKTSIDNELAGKIPYLLLNRADLEAGHRTKQQDTATRWMRLHDVLPATFPERRRPKADKPRTIKMEWGGLFTRG